MKKEEQNRKEKQPPKDTQSFFDRTNAIRLAAAVLVLIIFFCVGLVIWARPHVSEVEKRELEPFPVCPYNLFYEPVEFVNFYLSGEFTSKVSTWYADTFPTREWMVQTNFSLKNLYGFGDMMSGVQGDDIGGDMVFDPNAPIISDGNGDNIGGFWLKGDTAYELYAFSDANSKAYAAIINQAADKIGSSAEVYDIIVPLHYTFALSDAERDKTGASDCREAIRYMYSGMGKNVNLVNIIPALDAHRNEYIYYRTDHHWTARGAYYAYTAFCEAKGIAPTPLDSYTRLEFDGFLGTLYADTEQPAAMRKNPDTVEAFVPIGTNDITVTEKGSGKVTRFRIVNEQTNAWYPAEGAKYNCFIAGDNPYSEIHNPQKSDGSSVVIVKESFGNAFVPFLVDSYEYVYVIDYRYYDGNLVSFVKNKGIDDVIFLNNVIATSTSSRLNELKDIIE